MVEILIEDYEAGASTYELTERYSLRRATVRDTLRRAGFDLTVKAKRVALSEERRRPRHDVYSPAARPDAN